MAPVLVSQARLRHLESIASSQATYHSKNSSGVRQAKEKKGVELVDYIVIATFKRVL